MVHRIDRKAGKSRTEVRDALMSGYHEGTGLLRGSLSGEGDAHHSAPHTLGWGREVASAFDIIMMDIH